MQYPNKYTRVFFLKLILVVYIVMQILLHFLKRFIASQYFLFSLLREIESRIPKRDPDEILQLSQLKEEAV